MSTIRWLSDISGDFDNAANWKGGVVPGASDGAVLKAAGSPFTVTSSADETVKNLKLGYNATLAITGGTFAARSGTGGGANAGEIIVEAGANFDVGGVLKNRGGITLQGAGGSSASLLLTADTTLSGGGAVALGPAGGSYRQVIGAAAEFGTVTLTNTNNTISGCGLIAYGVGGQELILINQAPGVIEAEGHPGSSLSIGTSIHGGPLNTISNMGLIGASGGETLHINNTDISGSGEISSEGMGANDPTSVILYSCNVSGQNFSVNDGQAIIESSSVATSKAITNSGAIFLFGSDITFGASAALTGGGTVLLESFGTNGPASVIAGTSGSVVLTNVDNTIIGYGSIGAGELSLVNASSGIIRAGGGKLTIDTGPNAIINAGLIEVSSNQGRGVTLILDGPIDNTGVIADSYASMGRNTLTVAGAVTGSGHVIVAGGTINFKSSFSQNVTFTGTIGLLELAQSQSYTATITGFSTSGGTSLNLRDIAFISANEASFSGSSSAGVLTVSDGTHVAHINLNGDYLASTFTCSSDGKGGVIVTDSSGAPRVDAAMAPASPHGLVSAMAGLAPAGAFAWPPANQTWREALPALAAARGQLA